MLGIESSCDDTGAAVVRGNGTLLGESLQSQTHVHLKYAHTHTTSHLTHAHTHTGQGVLYRQWPVNYTRGILRVWSTPLLKEVDVT